MENECQDQIAFFKVLELWTNSWKFGPQLFQKSVHQVFVNLIKPGSLQLETNYCKSNIIIDIYTNRRGKNQK